MIVPQLHLMLIHFPIVGFIAASGLLLYALWRRRQEARTIALIGIVLSGFIVLPVLATGNASEDAVEELPGVSHTLLRAHSQAADVAGTLAVIAGVAALLALGVERWRPRLTTPALAAVLVTAAAATAGIAWTSHLGGEIRRPELALAWNGGDRQAIPEAADLTGSRGGESGERGEGRASLLGRLLGGGEGAESGERRESGEAREVRPATPQTSPGLGSEPQTNRHEGRAAEAGERGERKQRGGRDRDE